MIHYCFLTKEAKVILAKLKLGQEVSPQDESDVRKAEFIAGARYYVTKLDYTAEVPSYLRFILVKSK